MKRSAEKRLRTQQADTLPSELADLAMVDRAVFARLCGVTPRTVDRWLASGRLGHVKFDRTVRIPVEDARKFIEERRSR